MEHLGVGEFGIQYCTDPERKWYTHWFVSKKDRNSYYKEYLNDGKKVLIKKVDR